MNRVQAAFIPLGEDKTRVLLDAAQHGDFQAREELAEANLRLVRSIAGRFYLHGKDAEDLVQVGCIGLLKAIDRFDLSYPVCFSTYAVPLIMGEIRRYLRDDKPVSVSRSLYGMAGRLERRRRELQHEWGSEPELWHLAEACNVSEEQALAAIEAARPPLSIQESCLQHDGAGRQLEEKIADPKDDFGEQFWNRLNLETGLESLPYRLQEVIRCRYFSDMTQTELAKKMGVSQVQVSRLEKQALAQLRLQLLNDDAV